MKPFSIRYGGGPIDFRSLFLKFCGFLQGKKVVILESEPQKIGEILAASNRKGTFIETLIAAPAWAPIISTESVDDETWQELSQNFKSILGQTNWRTRLKEISKESLSILIEQTRSNPSLIVDAETISRLTLRVLYQLVFEHPISIQDEALFYSASIEWRKEIGMKGTANPAVKMKFWERLNEIVTASKTSSNPPSSTQDPDLWVSAFAQPWIISPQINVSDIMVAVFHFLRTQPEMLEKAKAWAKNHDRVRVGGIILEAIRLKHPFPILERELEKGTCVFGEKLGKNTQFFLIMDRFKQDPEFLPERWLEASSKNPYHHLPFGAGPRMCAGKPIAMELMVDLLQAFLEHVPFRRIQPSIGHLYSGRNNDSKTNIFESLHQIKTLTQAANASLCLRHQTGKKATDSIEKTP